LVVAGEASGDVMAARVVSQLGVSSCGMGGRELDRAGTELWFGVVSRGARGLFGPLGELPSLMRAYRTLLERTRSLGIKAALLVGFSEFNARLGVALRRRGVRVLWYAPPQIWARRPRRARALKRSSDRMALLFPFEVAAWREAGADAEYVGHPAIESHPPDRETLANALGLDPGAGTLALLPGSRAHEVRRMLPVFLETTRRLSVQRPGLQTRLLLSRTSLPNNVAHWAAHRARSSGVEVLDGSDRLAAFDVALCTSGTATLECVLSEVVPCIAYKTDRLVARLAKRLVNVEHVGLPNLVLGRRAFPEHLQKDANAENLQRSANLLFDEISTHRRACRDVRTTLAARSSPSERVAQLLVPWLN
jgi:lipid-A-disaccharide synthase